MELGKLARNPLNRILVFWEPKDLDNFKSIYKHVELYSYTLDQLSSLSEETLNSPGFYERGLKGKSDSNPTEKESNQAEVTTLSWVQNNSLRGVVGEQQEYAEVMLTDFSYQLYQNEGYDYFIGNPHRIRVFRSLLVKLANNWKNFAKNTLGLKNLCKILSNICEAHFKIEMEVSKVLIIFQL